MHTVECKITFIEHVFYAKHCYVLFTFLLTHLLSITTPWSIISITYMRKWSTESITSSKITQIGHKIFYYSKDVYGKVLYPPRISQYIPRKRALIWLLTQVEYPFSSFIFYFFVFNLTETGVLLCSLGWFQTSGLKLIILPWPPKVLGL